LLRELRVTRSGAELNAERLGLPRDVLLHARAHDIAQPQHKRIGDGVERDQPHLAAAHKPTLRQRRQMLRDIGLAGSGQRDQVAHTLLPAGERRHQLQPQRLAEQMKAPRDLLDQWLGEPVDAIVLSPRGSLRWRRMIGQEVWRRLSLRHRVPLLSQGNARPPLYNYMPI
jgi:hypothetical protein